MRNKNESNHPNESLLLLHIAEYDALMNRCTNFIAIHVGLWSVIVVVAAFVIDKWLAASDSAHPDSTRQMVLLWLGGAAIQALLHIWVTIIEEQYLTVSYIENSLRDAVASVVPNVSPRGFWRYEIFLERRRLSESWWGEWLMPAILLVLFVIIVCWRWPLLAQELPFVILNFALIIALGLRTYWRIKLRRSFARSIKAT